MTAQSSDSRKIIVSEAMYSQSSNSTNDEFIELYNPSETESVDFTGWRLAGTQSSPLALADTGNGLCVLAPKSYAVVLPANYFSEPHFRLYESLIPAGATVLKAEKSLSLDNSGDRIIFLNAAGDSVLDITYFPDAEKGYSLEKIDLTAGDDRGNFVQSWKLNGSPGAKNSVPSKAFDLSVSAPSTRAVPPDEQAAISCTVTNAGAKPFGAESVVRLFLDKNQNGEAEANEQISEKPLFFNLEPEAFWETVFFHTPSSATERLIFAVANAEDENSANDSAKTALSVGTARNAVIINEILYAPVQNSTDFIQDQPDFVELYNRSSAAVDLRGWSLSDAADEHGEFDTYFFAEDDAQNTILSPGQYAVVSPDKAENLDSSRLALFFPFVKSLSQAKIFYVTNRATFSYNNDGDEVRLKDELGFTIDSLRYDESWHHPFFNSTAGKSLERLNPDMPSTAKSNWSTCTDRLYGATPGKANSIFTAGATSQKESGLAISPNPFSPNADGHDDFTVIGYTLPSAVNRIRVKIFDVRGRLINTLENSLPVASKGEIIWDGSDKNGKRARMGIYIVLLEALSATNAAVKSYKATVVLAMPLN
ncbi:lamin tail domain-containing protein [Chloroherpeton thalassium]|uniref:lamin tail domain-containing protein n=1 Tax=Chloroherpeton thalassium TaxID=100716 RepID=UPI00145DCD81|nr:lamin tail domain-containing protein [Chloroherpeton thalassium]